MPTRQSYNRTFDFYPSRGRYFPNPWEIIGRRLYDAAYEIQGLVVTINPKAHVLDVANLKYCNVLIGFSDIPAGRQKNFHRPWGVKLLHLPMGIPYPLPFLITVRRSAHYSVALTGVRFKARSKKSIGPLVRVVLTGEKLNA